jgi:hypothetical protein
VSRIPELFAAPAYGPGGLVGDVLLSDASFADYEESLHPRGRGGQWAEKGYRPPQGRYLRPDTPPDRWHARASLEVGGHAREVWTALVETGEPAARHAAVAEALAAFRPGVEDTLQTLAGLVGGGKALPAAAREAELLQTRLGKIADDALAALDAAGPDREARREALLALRKRMVRFIDLPRPGQTETPVDRAVAGVIREADSTADFTAPREPDDAATLARHYAELYSALEDAGTPVPPGEADTANAELRGTGWRVGRVAGGWRAVPDAGDASFAAERAPVGGVTIGGKFYRGGQFIPAAVVAKATPEEKAALERGKEPAEAKAATRRARGPLNVATLRGRLAPHAAPLSREETRSAASSWRMLLRHHGGLALHRVEELATLSENALAGIAEDHPNAEGLRTYFGRQLAKYHGMLDMAHADGVTGKVEAPPAVAGRVVLPDRPSQIDIHKGWQQARGMGQEAAADFLDQVERKKGAMALRSLAMEHGVSLQVNPGGKGTDLASTVELRRRILDTLTPAAPSTASAAEPSTLSPGGGSVAAPPQASVADAIRNTGAPDGQTVLLRDLRRQMPHLKGKAFDAAVLDMAEQGKVFLHRFDQPGALSPKERAQLVQDEDGVYYGSVAVRPGTVSPPAGESAGAGDTSSPGGGNAAPAGVSYASGLPPVLNRIEGHGLSHTELPPKAKAVIEGEVSRLRRGLNPEMAALLGRVRFGGVKFGAGKVSPDAAGISLPGQEPGAGELSAYVGVDPAKMLGTKGVRGSKAFADQTPAGMVRHELGHALEHLMSYEQMAPIRLALSQMKWRPSLSADQNLKEKWAEFFAHVTRPGFDPATLPPEARTLAMRVLAPDPQATSAALFSRAVEALRAAGATDDVVEMTLPSLREKEAEFAALWDESKRRRGQPKNKGQFATGGGGGGTQVPGALNAGPASAPTTVSQLSAAEAHQVNTVAGNVVQYLRSQGATAQQINAAAGVARQRATAAVIQKRSPQAPGGLVAPPAAPGTPPPPGANVDHKASLSQHLTSGIDTSPDLSDADRQTYRGHVSDILSRMGGEAARRYLDGSKQARFYADHHQITDFFKAKSARVRASMEKNGTVAMGAYDPRTKSMHVDGGKAGKGVLAHEMAHAIDGNNFEISRGKGWQQAFHAELSGKQLSAYASTNAQEAFAEFGRALLTGELSHEVAQKKYAKSYGVWKAKGLI